MSEYLQRQAGVLDPEFQAIADRAIKVFRDSLKMDAASAPVDPMKELCEALEKFVVTLTNGRQNRDNTLSIDHDRLRALITEAEAALENAKGDGR